MLISVVWRILSLENVSKISLKSEPPNALETMVAWRRRSRVRRILNQLRSIRRTQPHFKLQYLRENQNIFVFLNNEQDYLLFILMWPQNLPGWIRQ
jgi:hypothetical protein